MCAVALAVVSFCTAPSASLYLDQHGAVRACCQNGEHPLGKLTERSLRDIWHGGRARRLREAVARSDLSLGCGFCEWQVGGSGPSAAFARNFDHLDAVDEPLWPQQIEFSLSNACNLQCVMCNGDWSSSIRLHREHRPPLPAVYGEAFFEELSEFLPHLRVAKFLGGEPFLGAESLRVLDMIADLDRSPSVHVTTNGTQWSERIERILDRSEVHVAISLDGVHREIYEAIRIGSSFDTVMENLGRFQRYTERRGTHFALTFCLMAANWRSFGDFLRFAESRDAEVDVNTVTEPQSFSLYHLQPREMLAVVAELERQSEGARSALTGTRRRTWDEQLRLLQAHARSLESRSVPVYLSKRRDLGFSWLAPPEVAEESSTRLRDELAMLDGWVVEVRRDGTVASLRPVGGPAGEITQLVRALVDVGAECPSLLGPAISRDDSSGDHQARQVVVHDGAALCLNVGVTRVASRSDDGTVEGATVLVTLRGSFPSERVVGAAYESDDSIGAYGAAVDVGGSTEAVSGFSIDHGGRITRFLAGGEVMFGTTVGDLVGQSAELLTDRLASLGEPCPMEPISETAQLVHRAQRFLRDGRCSWVVHSFAEPSGDGHDVWVTRRAPARRED